MIVERCLTDQIDSINPSVLYSTDLRETLRVLLSEKYVGICFKQCYVIEVVSVDINSPPILEAMRNGGSARMAVSFRVRGIVYDKFEVIPDAKIIEINEDGKIILRSKYAAIILAANAKLQKFRTGMVVPVRVVGCSYIPYRGEISVQCIPFVPIISPISESTFDVNIVSADMNEIEHLLKRVQDLRKKATANKNYKEWAELLDPKTIKVPDFKSTEITKVSGSGQIARPYWMPIADETVFWKASKEEYKIKNSATVLKGFIQNMIRQLELVIALAEQYDWSVEKSSAWVDLYRSEK